MASINPYPSGSDIIAPLPLYTPDFSAINTMMQRRAAMFEQGLSQVKSSDSLVRNAALSVSDNQVVRDQYVKQAEDQLKKLQGADFSQMQNVEAAQQVYAPFWQDRELLEDYSKTQAISSERARAEALAQSSDPKQRELFWKTGLDYVNLSANALSLAKRGDGSISKVKVNKYVPFYDSMAELQKRAKDQGLQIEVDYQDGPNKEYKITRTNGEGAVPIFKEWAAEQLASMPQAEDMFRVEGTVMYRQQIQNLQAQGYEEGAAKKELADRYMLNQKQHYASRYEDLDGMVGDLTKKIDALDVELKAKYEAGTLTVAEKAKRQELARQLDLHKNKASSVKQSMEMYSNPDSKEYQDEYGSLLNGGEDAFRKSRKNDMINNFARSYAANSKFKMDIDPVYKENIQLQKEMAKLRQEDEQFNIRYGDGSAGSGRSGSSGKKDDEANPLDAPVYLGRTIFGNDIVSQQQRLNENYRAIGNKYYDSGISIINEAGMLDPSKMVSPVYQKYLKETLTTGKYTKSAELDAEHKRLQDLKIVPASYKLGDSPSEIYTSLYSRSVELLSSGARAGKVNSNVFERMMTNAQTRDNYFKLREINNQVEGIIMKDPMFKPLVKDGKLMTKTQFMKNKLGYSDKATYVKNVTLAPTSNMPRMSGAAPVSTYGMEERGAKSLAEGRWEETEAAYDKAFGLIKSKTATQMQRYIGVEDALIGETVQYSTDRQGDPEIAQRMATQTLSPANLANQIVDKDGISPQNIALLESKGADRGQVRELINLTAGNIGNLIDNVRVTKVGITGKPTVSIVYNTDELKKILGEKKFNEEGWQKTLQAIGSGIEFSVDQAQIDNIEQDFELPGTRNVNFDKNDMVQAPAEIKKFGFDYTVLKDSYSKQYSINFTYPVNGVSTSTVLYAPLDKPFSSVIKMLNAQMFKIYTGNQQALQKSNPQGNFISRTEDYNTMINK